MCGNERKHREKRAKGNEKKERAQLSSMKHLISAHAVSHFVLFTTASTGLLRLKISKITFFLRYICCSFVSLTTLHYSFNCFFFFFLGTKQNYELRTNEEIKCLHHLFFNIKKNMMEKKVE